MRIRRSRGLLAFAALVCSGLPAPGEAQTGTVQGRVRDDQGSAVFGATVVLDRDGSDPRGDETDRLGFFRIDGVPPGTYVLRAFGFGYAETTLRVEVPSGEVVGVELRLPRRAVEIEGLTVGAERTRARERFEEIGGVTVREMSREELVRVPGVAEADPLRAVEVLPGVVSTSDFSSAFHVRGGSQDQNLILLDGVPLFSPFHLGGFFSVFNADLLERAELQSGGFPARHGGRVSSVLEIESDPGRGDFQVDGGVSLLSSRLAVAGGAPRGLADALGQANVHWRFGARRSYFDWLLKPVFDFPYHLQDFQGVIEGWTRGGDRIRITGYTGDDVLDLTRMDEEDFPLRADWDWGNDAIGARWIRPRQGGGSIDVHASWSRFGTGLGFPDFADTEFSSGVRQARAGFDLDLRPASGWRLALGGSVDRMAYDNLVRTGGTDFTSGRGKAWLGGAYAQGVWSRQRSWVLEAGIRLDAWQPDVGPPLQELAPRVAVKRFFAGGDGALKVAAGRYTQFVHSVRDEALPLGIDVWVLAGPRAPGVVSDQVQVGLEGYPREDLFLSLEAYVRGFEGVITVNAVDDPNDPLDDFLAGRGRSWGADLMLQRERGAVNGWLALAFLKAERTFPDDLSAQDPPPEITYPPIFDRRIDADLVLRFPLPRGWEGGLRWNLGTGIPYTRALGSYASYTPRFVGDAGRLRWDGATEGIDLGGYAVHLEDRNASRYPVYHRLDVSARRTFRTSWGTVVPHLDVLNVYNRRNVLFYFYQYSDNPPVRAGVSMFPFLPTLGLEVHF